MQKNYPASKRYKIYQRMYPLQRQLGDLDGALETLDRLQESLKAAGSNLPAKSKTTIQQTAHKDRQRIKREQASGNSRTL